MKVILLGAPGSGKGTQAALISKGLNIPHISTGDIFRDNIKRGTELGLKIKAIIDAGDLCPDDLTIEIVKNRLSEPDCKNGYLLDGFPRNTYQAVALDGFAAPDRVIELAIPLEKLEHRLTGRRGCLKCKSSFHIDFIGDRKDCPHCGGELYVREDDNPTSVKERLNVYREQTAPLIEYYDSQGKLFVIDADRPIERVFDGIRKVLK
ncbi:MAG: adenylate kinase [Clostridia bacterium]|nr:adenylate kinase [Clostridia bacterium]MBO4518191.1 adenylate kinase [Clostridia bacterium]